MSSHTLDNTGPRRFLVIEQDAGTLDEQAAVLLHLGSMAPLTLAVHSGNRSLHGWFFCAGQPEERLRRFMRRGVSLGADLSAEQAFEPSREEIAEAAARLDAVQGASIDELLTPRCIRLDCPPPPAGGFTPYSSTA